jgi:hypothetical protein
MGEIQEGGSTPQSVVWFWPLLWIVFVGVATIPLTAVLTDRIAYGLPGACHVTPGFFGATADCPSTTLLLMLTPGLLNLVPLWWLRSPHPKTRLAALYASCLGALRLIVPAIAVLASPTGASIDGPDFLWVGFPNAGYGPSFTFIGLVLWLATFPAFWLVARRR